ncbi:response regulator transcription factor [uncultured Sutterella sp.]|uniref:response regulator transcription factor n=2 Tax=uncultured Sutterella sp. TaxID=286133 RepID=UPI0025E10CC4|nr:response regulator [uncultured Sutterella sp.]
MTKSEEPLIRIVDDDEALCEAISFVLEGEGYETAVYQSAESYLEKDDPSRYGVLLLDVKMGGMSGPELQEALIRAGQKIPIIFLSAHGSIDLAVDLMQKGAVSFISKPVGSEKLLATIEHALKDAPVFGASHAEAKIATDPLSDREEQVVRLVCEGLTNRQIAERLGVSKRTIEFFRANAMRKLGAHNAKELQHRFQLKY